VKKNLRIAVLMTIAATILLGVIYPLVVTAVAQLIFPRQANGEMIQSGGQSVGSHLLGQPFTQPGYFYSRPSGAGAAGYDATASGSGNLGPTNKDLINRVSESVKQLKAGNPQAPIPVDLVTQSGSGLDPDISPAGAEYQVPRVARERGMSEADVRAVVARHTEDRQFRFLGEPRVNVLELNLDLDQHHPMH
jgi:potassium-transporting ATPase KdpC subunit